MSHLWGDIHPFLVLALVLSAGMAAGKLIRHLSLPSLLGYILLGIVLGPYGIGILTEPLMISWNFVIDIGLGLVALEVGSSLSFKNFARTGKALAWLILGETFAAFFLIVVGVYLFCDSLPLALLLGAIGAASAPAGTVAVIQDCHASGPVTRTLYAVVGFDDGLAVVLYGLALVFAKALLLGSVGLENPAGFYGQLVAPMVEIGLSVGLGLAAGWLFLKAASIMRKPPDLLILTFAMVLLLVGASLQWHLSLVIANMAAGMLLVNLGREGLIARVHTLLEQVMPLVFVVFFTLAGAHLDLASVASIGVTGAVYFVCRCFGKAGGAWLGGTLGGMGAGASARVGLGILSQAGLAIGLAMVVSLELRALADIYDVPQAAEMAAVVLTTITATTVLFEILGPILTRYVLVRAGETHRHRGTHP